MKRNNNLAKAILFITSLVAYAVGTYISFSHLQMNGSVAATFGQDRYDYIVSVGINFQLFFAALFCGLKWTILGILTKVYSVNDTVTYFLTEAFIRLASLSLLDLRLRQVAETDFHARLYIHIGDMLAMVIMSLYNRYAVVDCLNNTPQRGRDIDDIRIIVDELKQQMQLHSCRHCMTVIRD